MSEITRRKLEKKKKEVIPLAEYMRRRPEEAEAIIRRARKEEERIKRELKEAEEERKRELKKTTGKVIKLFTELANEEGISAARYRRLADESELPTARKILDKLASEEQNHVRMLHNLVDELQKELERKLRE